MEQVFILDHRYYAPERNDPDITHIAYCSSLEKAKEFAEKHYGKSISWVGAYDSVQSQNGGLHEYIIYAEMIDQFTEFVRQ